LATELVELLIEDLQHEVVAVDNVLRPLMELSIHSSFMRFHSIIASLFQSIEASVDVTLDPRESIIESIVCGEAARIVVFIDPFQESSRVFFERVFHLSQPGVDSSV
jgi:hypothetical protein